MLVLTRKIDETIVVNGNIEIKITRIGKGRVRLGITAPEEVCIRRAEVVVSDDRRCHTTKLPETPQNQFAL